MPDPTTPDATELAEAERWVRARLREDYWSAAFRHHVGPVMAELDRLRAVERRVIDARRGNASETDEYERGWLDACAEILHGENHRG